MIFFTAASALINFATSILFGLLVLIRNSHNKINYSFSLYAFSVALWSICYFFWQISTNIADALFWLKALMVFAIMIPAFYSQFVFVLTGLTRKKLLFLILAYLLLGLFIPIDIFGSYFIQEVQPLLDFKFWPIAGPLFHVFLVIWLGYVIYDTYLLYDAHKKATGILKKQIKYIFWGLALAFLGGITNYFLWYKILIPPFGNILVSAYVTLTAVAIIRYRLMDIRLILARTIAYSLIIVVISIFYVGVAFTLSALFLKTTVPQNHLLMYMVLTILIALSFERLRQFIEEISDRIFFKGRYDSSQLLSKLAHITSSNIELHPLVELTLQLILKEMRITNGALILKTNNYYQTISEGFDKELKDSDYSFTFSLDINRTVVFDDLKEGDLKESMRNLNISFAKVLHVNNSIIGFLVLGEKASGEMYSEQDLKVFDILSPELAVAVQNAESYDKIKRFNVTLEDEVKKATSDLQAANLRLQELDRLKNDFVSIASHELRTPMTAIRSYVWMALNRPDVALTEKMKKYLSRTLISTERLINLVNDMLNVSRIESGSIAITPKEFDIMALTDEAVQMILPKASEKNIKVEVVKGKIPTVFADPDKVTQVMLNLIGNSLKFTPIEGKISLNFFTDGKVVEVSVKDNGVGISKDDLSRLFMKFGRLDNSYTAAATSGGTGLGLFISKSLVELMHGKIWASSEGSGKGATFTFSLPVLTPEILAESEKYFIRPIGIAKELEQVSLS